MNSFTRRSLGGCALGFFDLVGLGLIDGTGAPGPGQLLAA